MLVTLNSSIQAVKVKTRLSRIQISIRVVGANSIRIGKTREEVETQPNGNAYDGLEILSGDQPYVAWWGGDLWAIAVNFPAQFVVIENSNTSNAIRG